MRSFNSRYSLMFLHVWPYLSLRLFWRLRVYSAGFSVLHHFQALLAEDLGHIDLQVSDTISVAQTKLGFACLEARLPCIPCKDF